MSFFNLFTNKCSICKRKIKPLRKYIDDKGKGIKVCLHCTHYAERRAYRVIK